MARARIEYLNGPFSLPALGVLWRRVECFYKFPEAYISGGIVRNQESDNLKCMLPIANRINMNFRIFAVCTFLFAVSLLAGCTSAPMERDTDEVSIFGASRMRLHPIFSQVKDWTGDNLPDGVEAELEFQDQFGDPTKCAGKVMFELFAYRKGYPDPRGDRVANPWVGVLSSLQDQHDHWNRTSRTYSFQLSQPGINLHSDYVLTAMFEHNDGRRFFGRVILIGQAAEPKSKNKPGGLLDFSTTKPAVKP